MRRNKKGAIEVSINTIIILIFAVVILSLGVMFIRNMFARAEGGLIGATAEMEKQMLDDLKNSNEKLTIQNPDIIIKAGAKLDTWFGVSNHEPAVGGLTINKSGITCDVGIEGNPAPVTTLAGTVFTVKTLSTFIVLDPQGAEVYPLQIKTIRTTPKDKYPCKITLELYRPAVVGGAAAAYLPYAEKIFYITVE